MRIQGNILYSRFSFELINFSFNTFYKFNYVSIDAMYLALNVMSLKIVGLVVTLNSGMK